MKTSHIIASFFMLPTAKMRKTRRLASFLMLSSSKNEEVSQNCFVIFVFAAVNIEK